LTIMRGLQGLWLQQCEHCFCYAKQLKPSRHSAECLLKTNMIYEFPGVKGVKVCLVCGAECGDKQHVIAHYVQRHSREEVRLFGYCTRLLQVVQNKVSNSAHQQL
jgi:hypothetical protein